MSVDMSLEHKAAARIVVSPILMNLLQPYNGKDLQKAIKEDVDLGAALKQEEGIEMINTMRQIIQVFPFASQVPPYLKDKKWINWFIEKELKKKRPDLYGIFVYLPKGRDWLHRSVKGIVDALF